MANQDTARSLHVVVVSDDPHIRDEARYGFPKDWTLTFADDAREVWPALRGDRPTVVVADMQTGNAGGYAMARAMSESTSLREVPVLILLERPQDAWLARTAGASTYRVKPLEPGELGATTRELAAQN